MIKNTFLTKEINKIYINIKNFIVHKNFGEKLMKWKIDQLLNLFMRIKLRKFCQFIY